MKWQNRNPSFIMLILISNKPLYFLSFNSLSALHFKIYKCPMTIQSFYIVFKHLQKGGGGSVHGDSQSRKALLAQ